MDVLEKRPPLQSSNIINIPEKSIEETYQKKTQLEHILLRPDTYIGSIEKHTQALWVYEDNEMVYRSISFVPGLYKIFDEILVNAADNKQRDPSMDCVKVVIDPDNNLISVYNNGDGVPVEIHKEEGVYVPELIFGHLLTSSNYDDSMKKTTGGRNGYGAKLTNIFSTDFVIETADGKRQKKYKQVFSNNMGKKTSPSITKCRENENWTKVTFKPDLSKFNMDHLEEDVVALMKKRVVDIAGCLGRTVKVELNGERLPIKSFLDYVNLYLQSAAKSKPDINLPKVFEKVNDRWEVCVSVSEGQFQQVSFVNSIATIKGGTHVDYVTNQITSHIVSIVKKKNKNANIKAHSVKNHLWVFVNSLIDNPAFDSQTKETLTIRHTSFGSKCELSQDLLKKVAKSGIVESLLSWADFKQSKDLKKTDGAKRQRITGITKLEDANDAGGRHSDKCTLILTEGDSAKALAMAGISVVGRDFYGVFPLRGKLLNVREASHKQIMENAEIQNIKQIMGLQHGKQYDCVKPLRYGHLMIMTDQDHDGSHIKGLLINFIHSFWPSLLKVPSFLVEFITPIVKASHKKGDVLSFYSMPEYELWKESIKGNAAGWSIKYYKGLGTNTPAEGKEYFKDLGRHKKEFLWNDDQEDGDAIELAFSKKKIEARKNWLRQFEPGTYLDQTQELIRYSDFVNKELILFSMADLQRSIPSMVDGFKPGQRKILFCSFKRKFYKEAKVSQFSGYVSEHSAYHHGEQSLSSTIIGMAQDFIGSNNINLLQPNGQFGTRHQGGKDHASARYLFTELSPVTRLIFPQADDILLDYLNEDGVSIEPTWYIPIIPMVLVNGSEGIGTGWSTFVPNYNPRDIVANIRRLLNGEDLQPMDPWYKGFTGTIENSVTRETGVTYTVSGIIQEIDETTLRITELPIRRWTQDYKEFLESVMTGTEKIKDPFVADYREHNDDVNVHFEVSLSEECMMMARQEGLTKKFRLTNTFSTSNMHLFSPEGVIKKYDTPEEILREFFVIRLDFYEKRKKVHLENLEIDLLKLENKVRFIIGVVEGEIVVSNRRRAELIIELHQKEFTPFPAKTKTVEDAVAGAGQEEVDEEAMDVVRHKGVQVRARDYDYLLSMHIYTLTWERVQQLLADRDALAAEVEELKKATPMSLWLKDLDALDSYLNEEDNKDDINVKDGKTAKTKVTGALGLGKAMPAPRRAKAQPKNGGRKATTATAMEEVAYPPVLKTVENVITGRGRGGGRKGNQNVAPVPAPVEIKLPEEEEEVEDEVENLKERLAAYNLDSTPEREEAPITLGGKKRAAGKKKQQNMVEETESEEENNKKGRRGGGQARKKKPLIGKKVVTEMLKKGQLAESSPEKKVRRMRNSPFNKKSSSVVGGKIGLTEEEKQVSVESSGDFGKVTKVPQRWQPRANQRQARYVLSESEEDEEAGATEEEDDEYDDVDADDSDF